MEKVKSKSLKFKLITFAILSVIAAGVVVNGALKNNIRSNNDIEISNKAEVKDSKTAEIKPQQLEGSETKEQQQLKQIEEGKQQQLKKKQEELEKKWKIGYDEFFAKQYEKAIETERQVIKEDPTFYKAYAVEGIALAYSGNFDTAMQQIDKSLELKPDYGYEFKY